MKISISFILLITTLVAAALLLERSGITRDISAALVLSVGFIGLVVHRAIVLKKRLGGADLLLAAPICLALALVVLKETGVLGVPSTVIWIAVAIFSIFAVGYVSPLDGRSDTAQ